MRCWLATGSVTYSEMIRFCITTSEAMTMAIPARLANRIFQINKTNEDLVRDCGSKCRASCGIMEPV